MASEEKVTRVYAMTPDTAELFFAIVSFYSDHGGEDNKGFRDYLMEWLASKGFVDAAYDTKRLPSEVLRDYKEKGFDVAALGDFNEQD